MHYNPRTWADEYLTFVALENGTFTFNPLNGNVISYSTDNGSTWTEGNSVEVSNGDKVMWKSNFPSATYRGNGYFKSTAQFDVQGNIMSLVYGDDFKGKIDLSGKNYVFGRLFYDVNGTTYLTTLVNAENLVLPATTLATSCYSEMFRNCTSLTQAPELPATTLVGSCYSSMFYHCTSLTTAPELPATELADGCYQSMFRDCTSLTQAPQLLATTLTNNCYNGMFYWCPSLTTAPELPATTLTYRCYMDMFRTCTSLTTAPELPATTLAQSCYENMFYGCTNLTSITCLATDISESRCTSSWVGSVSASGTFIKAPSMSSWTTGGDGIPSGWTVQDAS